MFSSIAVRWLGFLDLCMFIHCRYLVKDVWKPVERYGINSYALQQGRTMLSLVDSRGNAKENSASTMHLMRHDYRFPPSDDHTL